MLWRGQALTSKTTETVSSLHRRSIYRLVRGLYLFARYGVDNALFQSPVLETRSFIFNDINGLGTTMRSGAADAIQGGFHRAAVVDNTSAVL
jgi:hypothetical protein